MQSQWETQETQKDTQNIELHNVSNQRHELSLKGQTVNVVENFKPTNAPGFPSAPWTPGVPVRPFDDEQRKEYEKWNVCYRPT